MKNSNILASLDRSAAKGMAGFAWLAVKTERFGLVVLPATLSFFDRLLRFANLRSLFGKRRAEK